MAPRWALMECIALVLVVVAGIATGRRTILQVYLPSYTSLTIANIDASNIDVIAYSFATVTSGGLCALVNSKDSKNLPALLQLKTKFPHLRTTLSIGGADVAAPFQAAAATNASRTRFAASCASLAANYSFDGLDVDWEVPVQSDATTYPLLVAALRAALPPGSLLTTASNTGNALQFQMAAAVAPVVDWISIMGYPYTGSWETNPITKHASPLFPSKSQPKTAGAGVLSYLAAGVPAGQLVLGVPFYGFQRTGVASTRNLTGIQATGLFVSAAASPYYQLKTPQIQSLFSADKNWTVYWDATANATYAYNPVQASFITYESTRSLAVKAQYVGARGLLGMMVWELSQDDSSNTLLNAIVTGLRAVSQATTSRSRTKPSSTGRPNTKSKRRPTTKLKPTSSGRARRTSTSRTKTRRPSSRQLKSSSSRRSRSRTRKANRSSTKAVNPPSQSPASKRNATSRRASTRQAQRASNSRAGTRRPSTRTLRRTRSRGRTSNTKPAKASSQSVASHTQRPPTGSRSQQRTTTMTTSRPGASRRRGATFHPNLSSSRRTMVRASVRSPAADSRSRLRDTTHTRLIRSPALPVTRSAAAEQRGRPTTSPATVSPSSSASWFGLALSARVASFVAVIAVTFCAACVIGIRRRQQQQRYRQYAAYMQTWMTEPAM